MKMQPKNELKNFLIIDPVSVTTSSTVIVPEGSTMDTLLTCVVLDNNGVDGYKEGDILLYRPAYIVSKKHARLNGGIAVSFLNPEGVIGVCTLDEGERLEPATNVSWEKGESYRIDKSKLEWITGRA